MLINTFYFRSFHIHLFNKAPSIPINDLNLVYNEILVQVESDFKFDYAIGG